MADDNAALTDRDQTSQIEDDNPQALAGDPVDFNPDDDSDDNDSEAGESTAGPSEPAGDPQ